MIDNTESGFNDIQEKDLHYSGFTLKAVEKHGRHQGWALPGGGFTESRKVAQQVADQLAGNAPAVSLKEIEMKRGIGGPYAIPFYV